MHLLSHSTLAVAVCKIESTLSLLRNMKTLFFEYLVVQVAIYWAEAYDRPYLHWMEKVHNPARFATNGPAKINGTDMPDFSITPDYRVEEPPFLAYHPYKKYVSWEMLRPIRISPHYKQTIKWIRHPWYNQNIDYPGRLGCYCTTVYKKFTVLAGCAVLTNRHVLTTATSVELVIRKHNARKYGVSLVNILGFWCDNNDNVFNSSIYDGVSRIHYHPRYVFPEQVNISHPIPCVFDLAVLATEYNISPYPEFIPIKGKKSACLCYRGSSHTWEYAPSTPQVGEIMLIVGFQFVKAHKKKPMPWYKYVVRTAETRPCPKTEWGWFSCIQGQVWAKYGLDSGAALHRALHHNRWVYDGLIGMNAFSMRLRSDQMMHYFTVLDSHPVLDFLYDAYMGYQKYEYIDPRYANTKGDAPLQYTWSWVAINAIASVANTQTGAELYKGFEIPDYKR